MKTTLRLMAIVAAMTLLMMPETVSAKKHNARYYKQYAIRLADSQIAHDPELSMADGVKKPKWDYTQGLVARAMTLTYQATNDQKYYKYVMEFANYFIQEDGNIVTYKRSDFNIDRVNGGTFLYVLNDIHPEPRFERAIDLLFSQLKEQPRTSEGGFWHKKIYPWQMWLDGLYMGEPFYCRYAREHQMKEGFDDIQLQFETVDKHTYDAQSGLNYHGWDESREQKWANPETGCSAHFWGRAMGWYVMAMVDVLDNMPKDHPGYASIQGMLERSAKNLLNHQDKTTHLWYQVLDMPDGKDNYQEATCSAIFCYAFAKAANRGYLPACYKKEAAKIFDSIVKEFLVEEGNGNLSLTGCCAVAGLGGNPYRDGTYDYYVHERKSENDPKGVGPLIMAALELAK